MKRKICESLFAVTLALTVAVTNIPVTAFATEIDQSARQEQTTESTQTGNNASDEESGSQGQQSGGLQENQGAQTGDNAGNGQNSTGDSTGTDQNTGVTDNMAGTDNNQSAGDYSQQVENKDNSGTTEAGTSGQQNIDAAQQEAQASEQAAVLSSDETSWEMHGKVTKDQLISQIKEKLNSNYYVKYRYTFEDGDEPTDISDDSIILKSGKYSFEGYKIVLFGKSYWDSIGTATIQVYYDVNFNISGTNTGTGGVQVNGNAVNSAKAYDGNLQFSVEDVDGYDVTVTVNNQELTAVNGVYSLSNLSDDAEVNVVYAPKAGANVTVTAEHASVQLNGSSANSGRVELNQDFPVVITPEDGYAVESVTVNGEKVTNLTFGEQYAASFTWNSGQENNADIKIEANVVKETLALKSDATVSYHKGMSVDRLKNNIFNSVVDKDSSIPSNISIDDVKIEYNAIVSLNGEPWKDLDYKLSFGEIGHAFGEKKFGNTNVEEIRISYKGDSQYEPFSETATITLSDERIDTQVVIQEGITIQYNTEDVMRQELLQYITVQDVDGNTLEVDTSKIELNYNRAVGQQTLTVKYLGDDDYNESPKKETTITITKGDASVSVNSQKITYGENFETPIFTASPEEARAAGIIAGITASGEPYVSMDLNQVMINDIAGKNIPVVGTMSVQSLIKSYLGKTSITVGELSGVMDQLADSIGKFVDISDYVTGVKNAVVILERIFPGIDDTTIHFGDLPTEAGVYTAVGMTVNSNYNTAIGVGTLVIAQKKTDAKLAFNQNIENKHNRLTAAEAESFDFGGHIEVDGNAVEDTPGIRTNFVGKTAEGKIVSGTEPIKEDGEYIETISIIGGNYLAAPIVRTYIIGEAKNTIKFEKKIAYAGYDGNEHGMTAYAYDEDGNQLGEAALEYQNISQNSANVYAANTGAPTDAGIYRVVATYENAKSEVGTLIITKAVAKGVVTVGDATTTYGQTLNLNSVILQTENIAQRDIAAIQDTLACAGSDEAIGSHAITVTVPESVSRNYLRTIKVNAGTHTITSKEVTITADSCKVQYGDTFPEFTYQVSGVSDTENIGDVSVVKREEGNHVGTYTLDVQVANQNPNYKYNLESGTLTIKKRAITVTIDKKQKVKGQKDPALTYTVEGDGLVKGDSLGIYLSRKSGEKVGLYDIYMDASNLNKDYELTSEPSGKDKFEIVENKAGLTDQKNDSGKSDTNGTQVKSVKKQPGTIWDRIKTGDNNKPVGYFIAVLISFAAILMILSARFQRKK